MVKWALEEAKKRSSAVALVVRKNSFSDFASTVVKPLNRDLVGRLNALEAIVRNAPIGSVFVATTGFMGRYLLQIRENLGSDSDSDFLVVGGMGHASQIASQIARRIPRKRVFCLDGDGALLMHLGGLKTSAGPKNLVHVLFNNGAHESVGGQITGGLNINFGLIAKEFGYEKCYSSSTVENLEQHLESIKINQVSTFLEVRCSLNSQIKLPRPSVKPRDAMLKFISKLRNSLGD